jgi:hypothetical protein
VIHSVHDAYGWHDFEVKPSPPSAEEITQMDEAFGWMLLIDDLSIRRIVWARAEGVPWHVISKSLHCGRTTTWKRWHTGIGQVVSGLKAKK